MLMQHAFVLAAFVVVAGHAAWCQLATANFTSAALQESMSAPAPKLTRLDGDPFFVAKVVVAVWKAATGTCMDDDPLCTSFRTLVDAGFALNGIADAALGISDLRKRDTSVSKDEELAQFMSTRVQPAMAAVLASRG